VSNAHIVRTSANKTFNLRTNFFRNISIITWNIWSWNESRLAGGQIDDPFAVRPKSNYSYNSNNYQYSGCEQKPMCLYSIVLVFFRKSCITTVPRRQLALYFRYCGVSTVRRVAGPHLYELLD
jgi:hypothetical protein